MKHYRNIIFRGVPMAPKPHLLFYNSRQNSGRHCDRNYHEFMNFDKTRGVTVTGTKSESITVYFWDRNAQHPYQNVGLDIFVNSNICSIS